MASAPEAERRVAMIAGAARGLGKAQALALARAGNIALGLTAHADLSGVAATAETCRSLGAEVVVVETDVSNGAQVAAAVARIVRDLGSLDILVNNAGRLGTSAKIVDMTEEVWREMIDSHLTGSFLAMKHAAPHMCARKWGRIVNLSSIHGRIGGRATLAHYGAAKAGVIALS
ncbi:MAG: SDR family NAD(P)-dependent oxidoreductase, partial [Alphaproteobacteria bacterium]